jgi:phosphonate transport system substrate-binding protein
MEKSLGKKVTVVKVTSYAACIEAMKKSRLEMAWFGPTSYVLAEQEANAEAVVVPSDSKGVSSYYSVIIVPASSTAKTVADLKGKRFGLVETSSTSGGLIPSYLVKKDSGETIEKFTNVSYLGNHDAVVNAVRQGAIDAGGTNNLTIERLLAEKKLKDSDFRILTKSDPLPQSPLAWRKDLPGDLKASIKKAIMESPKALGTYKIAGLGEVAGFREVSSSEYQLVRDIAKELGLTRERLLK